MVIFLTIWESLGCKDDQFLIPHDIAIDSEVTYMLQTVENHTLE